MNTNQKLPSDTLSEPTRRLPWILGSLGAAALVVAGVVAGPAIASNLNPTPTPTPTATEYVATLTPAEEDSVRQAADAQAAQIAAEKKAAADAAAAQAAAEAAAAAKASHHSSSASGGGLPAGSVVPSIPGTSSPDTTQCASGTASNDASGVAICD